MGPPFITAEWGARTEHRRHGPGRFNGAAVHHGGVATRSLPVVLQWRCFNGAAVHHGGVARAPIGSPGRRTALQWGRRSSRRSGPAVGAFAATKFSLQWGRRSSRRSGRVPPSVGVVDHVAASMGPPFITAEWTSAPLRVTPRSARLQWGRRSSRRSGSKTRRITSGSGRFYGAAVHHGGVGLAQDANKFEESQRVLRAG